MSIAYAKDGDTVHVHYRGRFEDGAEFDSSYGRAALEFTLGKQAVIRGFEQALLGMAVGEQREITVSPEEGYGPYRQDLVASIPRSRLTCEVQPRIGMILQLCEPEGEAMSVRILAIKEDSITVDGNHPLAGKILVFEIELVKIVA